MTLAPMFYILVVYCQWSHIKQSDATLVLMLRFINLLVYQFMGLSNLLVLPSYDLWFIYGWSPGLRWSTSAPLPSPPSREEPEQVQQILNFQADMKIIITLVLLLLIIIIIIIMMMMMPLEVV